MTGNGKETVELPEGATDAALTPYHIERGKLFVRERFAKNRHIAVEVLCANIEYTRFPVPIENEREAATDYPALLRASDLIGQLADPNYMRKISALFNEFEETGMNEKLGYTSSAESAGRLSEVLLVDGDSLHRRRAHQPSHDAGGPAVGGEPLLPRLRRRAQAARPRRRTRTRLMRHPGQGGWFTSDAASPARGQLTLR